MTEKHPGLSRPPIFQQMPRPLWSSPPAPEPSTPEAYESLHDLAGVLLARRKTVLVATLSCLLLGILACLLIRPQYTATAALEVNRESSAASGSVGPELSVPEDVKTEVETDTNVLQSDGLALEVIQQLHLQNTLPFSRVKVKAEAGLPLDRAPKTRDSYLHLFAKALKVASVPDSRLIHIAFSSPDPQVAAKAANTLSETFIADTMARRLQTSNVTSYWISREIGGLRDRVRDSEQALADFQHKTGLAGLEIQSIGQPTGQSSGQVLQAHNSVLDRLSALNGELTQAEAGRISSETIFHLTQSQDPETVLGLGAMNLVGGGTVLSQGGGLDLLRNLRSQQTALRVEYADLHTRFGPQNPRLVQLTSQLQAMDGEIAGEMNRIRARAENDYKYAQTSEAALRAQLAKQQHLADKFTDEAVQLQLLSQEALSNRTLYQNLYSQLNQANVAAGIHATRLDVVDRALVPGSPSWPKKPIVLAVSLAAGLVLGILLAFIQQSNDVSIRVARDVESTVHLPVLSQIPTLGEANMIAAPRSSFAEAYRFLCTAVVGLLEAGSEPRVLMIGSPLAGDGKSTVAYNLALALAQRGERVLLIDANLRSPALGSFFPQRDGKGLSEALETGCPLLADCAIPHAALSNLALLPAGHTPELPAELFSSHAFDQLLADARAHYRWTIVDSPPMLPFTDAAVIAEKVDGVVAVLRSGVTSRDILRTYATLLLRMRAPMLGFALNGVDAAKTLPAYTAPRAALEKVSRHA